MPKPSCDCANSNVELISTEPFKLNGESGTGKREHYKCQSCKREIQVTYSENGQPTNERARWNP
jgi:hypothetical protein